MDKESVGQIVRRLRMNRKLTQQELADMAGVLRQTVGFIERDEYSAPGPDKLAKIAIALEINPNELLIPAGYAVPGESTPDRIVIANTLASLKLLDKKLQEIIKEMEMR